MASYTFGDVVLAAFPFADQFEVKHRPALILSEDADKDLVFLRITSKIRNVETEVLLHDWGAAGLRIPSVVGIEKAVTSSESFILKSLGKLSHADSLRVMAALRRCCERISGSIV